MEDLIKVASNGQWKLEKAKQVDPKVQQMINEFMARKNAPPEPRKTNQAVGLKPVDHSSGANPAYSKEQVAAIRAGIAPDVVEAAGRQMVTPQQKHVAKVTSDIDKRQQSADEAAKTTQNRKAAWEAGVAFLAQHGDTGFKALQSQMQQRKMLDAAHETGKLPVTPKAQLLPPQEPFIDEKGNRGMRERQGTFHNQGATTTGKLKNKGVAYPDKATGEMRYTSVPQQEQHHWAWDHNKKKWNHMKTTMGNATIK